MRARVDIYIYIYILHTHTQSTSSLYLISSMNSILVFLRSFLTFYLNGIRFSLSYLIYERRMTCRNSFVFVYNIHNVTFPSTNTYISSKYIFYFLPSTHSLCILFLPLPIPNLQLTCHTLRQRNFQSYLLIASACLLWVIQPTTSPPGQNTDGDSQTVPSTQTLTT